MIDTIKFKIPADHYIISTIKEANLNRISRSNKDGSEHIFYTDKLIIDPYVGFIQLSITKPFLSEGLYLEFSIPKLVFGNNLYLFYPEDLDRVSFNIQMALEEQYLISLPSFKEWIIQRLDVCYVWKFESNTYAHDVLASLKSFEYPRKKTAVYDTSIVCFSDTFSVKFYLKKDEYYFKDYKVTHKYRPEKAQELLDFSEGQLRFEVEYRKKKLETYFQKEIVTVDDIADREVLAKILRSELKVFLDGFNPEIISNREVATRVIEKHGAKAGFHLFTFYLSYFKKRNLTLLKSLFSKSRIKRYLKQLSESGVGLVSSDKKIVAKLSVPSDLAPNRTNAQGAVAPELNYFVNN